jgi:hypothetical protein
MRIEYESNEIPIYRTITEDDEGIDTPEQIHNILEQIASDLGYQYIEKLDYKLGRGTIAVRNDVDIIIKYGSRITAIYVAIGNTNGDSYKAPMYNCTTNSSDIDDVSVALQTASMICSEIRKKLM